MNITIKQEELTELLNNAKIDTNRIARLEELLKEAQEKKKKEANSF